MMREMRNTSIMLKRESCCVVLSGAEMVGSMLGSPMAVKGTVRRKNNEHQQPRGTALKDIQKMLFALHLVLGAQGHPATLGRKALHHNSARFSARFFCTPRCPTKPFPSCCIHADPSEGISALPLPAAPEQPGSPTY